MTIYQRHNVRVRGTGPKTIVFAHGYGCDQNMWRFVAPAFEDEYRVVLFDYVGSGRSEISAYNSVRYNSLEGYADDLLALARDLDLREAILVAHSVSAMIGTRAIIREPGRFAEFVMISPSPCYLNDGAYQGGFRREEIDDLIDSLSSNYLGWSSAMAPVIMGNPERPELAEELENSFCRMDPVVAKNFARVTFLSDSRSDLPKIGARTLILQCSDDVIAPVSVGQYVREHVPNSELIIMSATGHCPNLSAPRETTACIKTFLNPERDVRTN